MERFFSDCPYPRHLKTLKSTQAASYAGAVTPSLPIAEWRRRFRLFYIVLCSAWKDPGDQGNGTPISSDETVMRLRSGCVSPSREITAMQLAIENVMNSQCEVLRGSN